MTLTRLVACDDPEARPDAPASSLADQIVAELAAIGISTYFGVPGGAIEPLFNVLARRERAGQVRLVPMRSESGAAFAADGFFRATGRMAVCTATTGPGISNMLTAMMAAHADRIPMLVITPQVPLRKQGRGALQDSSADGYDLPHILEECTRYSTTVTHPEQLAHKLPRALRTALRAPGGPVHLSLPSDVLGGAPCPTSFDLRTSMPPEAPPFDGHGVAELTRDLMKASAPVFYLGDDAGPEAHRLCDVAAERGAAVVSSPAGKRWVGHRDPAYRGVIGFSGHAEARQAVLAADLMIALGATFDELSTNAWSAIPNVPLYAVDGHGEHAFRIPHARPVIADPKRVVGHLVRHHAARRSRARRAKTPGAVEQAAAAVARGAVDSWPPPQVRLLPSDAVGAVHPSDLMRWLGRALPPDVVVHIDAGNSFSWSTRDLVRTKPDTYRVAMGLATMCWAIGAVIGAAVGRQRRSVCVTGDGSMLMSSLELTVAVDQRLPVTYIVLNDSGLGMVRHGQRMGGAEPIAHQIASVRFDRLAEACGAHGMRVHDLSELGHVPEWWLGGDDGGPCVIDVCIDRDAVPPMADRVAGLVGVAGVSGGLGGAGGGGK